ncbi:hypothetical protein VTN31DRAFT_2594 [Thermomyces dupontii]|uniref:uncharacterized protein n=1 Tax=Talaromyces thermophilus TaxID=28565 RepID=UPI003743B2B4
MSVSQETVDRIRSYAERGTNIEAEQDGVPLSDEAIESYNRKLDETIRSLQEHVKRQEDALRELRRSNQRKNDLPKPGLDLRERLAQVRRAKRAYDSLFQSKPDLPPPDSPLPSLVALRETARVIAESKASIRSLQESLPWYRGRLGTAEEELRDAKLITEGLRDRIRRLQAESADRVKKTPSQLAAELIEAERSKNRELERATGQLQQALDSFIDNQLAAMLAAEDLGGPVVGDEMDVPDATLEAGYTQQGKPKKPRSRTAQDGDDDPRQLRIDTFLRRQSGDQGDGVRPTTRREAAAAEMRQLLSSLLEAGQAYVDLPRESAASRFLVRAKAAQLHPRDARRIRLIDFSRSLED